MDAASITPGTARRRLADPSIALIVLGAVAGGLVQGLLGFAFGLISMALGARLYRRFSVQALRQLVLLLLLFSGIMLLVGSMPQLLRRWSAGAG